MVCHGGEKYCARGSQNIGVSEYQSSSGKPESLLDVVDQVSMVLDSCREPDKTVVDAKALALTQRLVKIAHDAHLLYERLAAAKTGSDVGNTKSVDEAACGFESVAAPCIAITL
jgi:hypothetical protein